MIILDHHIVPSRERDSSARWLSDILGLPAPRREGPFAAVDLGGDTSLFFAGWDREVPSQHYAFAVNASEFDRIVDRLADASIDHWADHDGSQPSTVRRDHDGSGVYFRSPDGHLLEVLTHPSSAGQRASSDGPSDDLSIEGAPRVGDESSARSFR